MSLDSLIKKINKDYGDSIFLGDLPEVERIPFSSPSANYVTRGGIAYGRSVEFVGAESSGKTTLAIDTIKSVQKIEAKRYEDKKAELEAKLANPKLKDKDKVKLQEELDNLKERVVFYMDLEQTFDPIWARKNGVDTNKMYLFRVPYTSVETHLDTLLDLVATGDIAQVVIDSIGAMVSDAEFDGDIGKGNFGGVSKALTKFYKKMIPLIAVNHVALVVLNHTKQDMSGYNQLVRPGGNMNKFAQTLVLELRPGEKFEKNYGKGSGNSELVFAKRTVIRVNKNKMANADRQIGFYTIKMGAGIDAAADAVDLAIALGEELEIVKQSGAWFQLFHPKTGEELLKIQGKGAVIRRLNEDQELFNIIWDALYAKSIEDEFDPADLFGTAHLEEM